MARPIEPNEIGSKKAEIFPDFVIKAFNFEIAKSYVGNRSEFRQDAVIAKMMAFGNVTRQTIFDNHWLDVEEIYRDAGWKVEYEKPAYNETGYAMFTFTKSNR